MIERTLKSLIQQANDGTIQIPEFQRELIVDDEWASSVLASVSRGYPIGAFMLLRAGNPDLEFETHPAAGSPAHNVEPEWLLVDGQRRLTVLYRHRGMVRRFQDYLVPIIELPSETTRWTVCVHGGPNGRELAEDYVRRARIVHRG